MSPQSDNTYLWDMIQRNLLLTRQHIRDRGIPLSMIYLRHTRTDWEQRDIIIRIFVSHDHKMSLSDYRGRLDKKKNYFECMFW